MVARRQGRGVFSGTGAGPRQTRTVLHDAGKLPGRVARHAAAALAARREEARGRPDARDLEARSDLRPGPPGDPRQAADEGRRHGPRLRRADEAGRDARRPLRQGDDLSEHRLPAGHGPLGRRAAARGRLADPAEGEPPPRLLLRLPQRRSQTDVSEFAAGRPGAGGLLRPAAGHRLLQAERPVARPEARRPGADRRARKATASRTSNGCRTSC